MALRIWETESDPAAQAVLDEIVREFESQNPHVKVEHEAISWGALSQKLTTALATGDPPDLVHLQPFMVASLHEKDLLEPIDDVIADIGQDDIYPAVRDLQYFGGHYYGIAYAIGTTYFSYRKDWAEEAKLDLPTTWSEYIAFLSSITANDLEGAGRFGVTLPGGSPFFVDQLTAELVASNGGRLFDEQGRPTFTEQPVIETLEFWRELAGNAVPDWTSEGYVDQFRTMATGRVASVPVTYARASKQIDQDAPVEIADPEHFAVFEQPVGPSGEIGFATIDAEPYVILSTSRAIEEAKAFLRLFYRRDNYLKYTSQVPIHLTPIFKSLAESEDYLNNPFIQKWKPWQDLSLQMLSEGRVRPILLAEEDDRQLPFLLELQGSRILTDMVLAVTNEGKDPQEAATVAQQRAEELIERLGYRRQW